MLAAQTADYDAVGQWMSHHLAELVIAAEIDRTTVEQRLEIVDTILKVWAHRRTFAGPGPLDDFSRVFAALDRLGDERPWRFLRFFEEGTEPPTPTAAGPQLLELAADLERLVRETVLHLLWRAAEKATSSHKELLDVAQKVQSVVEFEVTGVLRRHRRRSDFRRLVVPAEDAQDEANSHSLADADQSAHGGGELRGDSSSEDPFGDESHARLLREMARRLEVVADDLDPSETDKRDLEHGG